MRYVIILATLAASCALQTDTPDLRDGDIIFHTSQSSQSVAIQRATGSKYSHMGLVFHRNGRLHVLEAVATVRFTPLTTWIERGRGRHFAVRRLKNASVLSPANTARLMAEARKFEGKPYDLGFGWSDDHIYCSELVWKAYERALSVRIGDLQKMREFNLTDPIVRAKLQERYGGAIPLDEPVISPGAMFTSALLETVAER